MKKASITFLAVLLSVSFLFAQSQTGVKVLDKIIPNGLLDPYPTHLDSLGKGGLMTFSTWQERNSIPTQRRKAGMLVRVKSNTVDSTYTLGTGLTNADWEVFGSGSIDPGNFVLKSGDTMTGALTAPKLNPDTIDVGSNGMIIGNTNQTGTPSFQQFYKITQETSGRADNRELKFESFNGAGATTGIMEYDGSRSGLTLHTGVGGYTTLTNFFSGLLSSSQDNKSFTLVVDTTGWTTDSGGFKAVFTNPSGSSSDTIAYRSDIPDVSGKVNKSGDTMSGKLIINTPTLSEGLELVSNDELPAMNFNWGEGGVLKLEAEPNSNLIVKLPQSSGTIALTDGSNATGTWGINISGSANSSNLSAITNQTAGSGGYLIPFVDGGSGNRSLTVNSPTFNYNIGTNTISANISGNANSATNWGNSPGNFDTFGTGQVVYVTGYDGGPLGTNIIKPFQAPAVRTFLGIPSGGETLQSVTDRGNSTTNNIVTSGKLSSFIGVNNSQLDLQAISNSYSEIQSSLTGVGFNHPLVLQRQGGNVGIGTTSPSEKLHVNGNVIASDPTASNHLATKQYVDNSSGTGWAIYTNTGSSQGIVEGDTLILNNNAGSKIETQLPSDAPLGFYDPLNNNITPINDGDFYTINVRFTAESTAADGLFDVCLDIGGTQGIIQQETKSLRKGIGNQQRCSVVFPVYAGSTFVSNKGKIKVISVKGNTTVSNVSYSITRTHKAK